MFIGPVFAREVTIAPRRPWTFVARAVYGLILLLLVSTAWLVLTGTQLVRDTGDFARFAFTLFLFLAPFQLILVLFFSSMFSASAVAQEKDKKTLILLLLTRMSGSELVLGKLLASLLNVLVMIAVSLPIFMMIAVLGGVSYPQIVRVMLVTAFSAIVCGSLGSCIALWRDKTFQALAITLLTLVFWFGFCELLGFGLFGQHWLGVSAPTIAAALSPWRAMLTALYPSLFDSETTLMFAGTFWMVVRPIAGFLLVCSSLILLINGLAISMIRVWNPSRETRSTVMEEDTWRKEQEMDLVEKALERSEIVVGLEDQGGPNEKMIGIENGSVPKSQDVVGKHGIGENGKVRHVWDNPIIWREICTKAYGKKMWIVRATYFLFFLLCVLVLNGILKTNVVVSPEQLLPPLIPLFLLSLVLVNAQAVTSLTSERDGGTFDLLLVSDLTPKEFIYGKLGGIFWNSKEMVLFPLALCVYLYCKGAIEFVPLMFLFLGLLTLYGFVVMIGLHIGMQYVNSRSATATSLGIIFFLFVGIATCMWIMVAFSGSFEAQLQPFLAFMVGGAIGLYVTLGAKNPSNAILLSSFILPIATFYAITSLLLGQYHLVFIAVIGAYGFTTLAMLIPAVDEFDVATGRTTVD
ncbi:MAG: ABC transporter permease [Thermoguttaceae bacterium]